MRTKTYNEELCQVSYPFQSINYDQVPTTISFEKHWTVLSVFNKKKNGDSKKCFIYTLEEVI